MSRVKQLQSHRHSILHWYSLQRRARLDDELRLKRQQTKAKYLNAWSLCVQKSLALLSGPSGKLRQDGVSGLTGNATGIEYRRHEEAEGNF